MKNVQLSQNWWLKEFRCKCVLNGYEFCGGAAPVSEKLIVLLQKTRDIVNVPLYCVHESSPRAGSGFRCIPYNALVGGVPESYHTRGMAADIWAIRVSALEISAAAQEAIAELGYGWCKLYPDRNFVHIDVGEH